MVEGDEGRVLMIGRVGRADLSGFLQISWRSPTAGDGYDGVLSRARDEVSVI